VPPRREPPAPTRAPQAPTAPAVEPVEGEPPPSPENPTEEAELAEGARELCADAGLAREGVNTAEEIALDRELQQACAESELH
jgi:hypothetical protein